MAQEIEISSGGISRFINRNLIRGHLLGRLRDEDRLPAIVEPVVMEQPFNLQAVDCLRDLLEASNAQALMALADQMTYFDAIREAHGVQVLINMADLATRLELKEFVTMINNHTPNQEPANPIAN